MDSTATDRGWLRFGLFPLLARLMLGAEFAIAVNGKISGWDGQAAYMARHGLHWIAPLLAMALVIELVGTLCLVTGFVARTASAIMFVYLGIVSLSLHDFWHMSGNTAGMNQTEFFKNLGMMGGLLLVSVYGPGRWALSSVFHIRQRTVMTSARAVVSHSVMLADG
jgi:putative oxidoreductase